MLVRVARRCFSVPASDLPPAFESLDLPLFVKRIFKDEGFSEPTPIQSQVWPLATAGRDVVGIAKTGSGKTLAYSIPLLMNILKSTKNNLKVERGQQPISLILLPTRELCKQVGDVFFQYALKNGFKVATVFGGAPRDYQKRYITPGVHTIIGTPGRLMDFMNDETVKLNNVSTLVLDEADLMLDMGFEEDIRRIVSSIEAKRQTMMFTATWPDSIKSLADDFLNDPAKVTIGNSDLTMNEDITHSFFFAPNEMKKHYLLDLISQDPGQKYLIFVNTKKLAEELRYFLNENNFKCDALHSNKQQTLRNAILRDFKKGDKMIMIATDVASRGLDIKGVSVVINYDVPRFFDDYIHRVGRTGRAGGKGNAISFVNDEDNKAMLSKLKGKLKEIGQTVPGFFKDLLNKETQQSRY
jgi:ATP-dependent RNA helicase DDX5/DBP2